MNNTYTDRQIQKFAEFLSIDRLITDIHPTGIVSLVSDTFDLWDVVGGSDSIVSKLKDKIMNRAGKVVIRPDSGCPVRIICGYTANDRKQMTAAQWDALSEYERRGVVGCLYDIFGGTETAEGYLQLDEHIGAIYGDSITLARAQEIFDRLAANGFATTNVVFGIGSFTYQGAINDDCIVTRDSFGYAIKATYGEVNGEPREIFKDPITDSGLKKSLKGLIAVYEDEDGFYAQDQSTFEDVKSCSFREIWTDGIWITRDTLQEIRDRIAYSI